MSLGLVPGFAADSAAATLSAIVGLCGLAASPTTRGRAGLGTAARGGGRGPVAVAAVARPAGADSRAHPAPRSSPPFWLLTAVQRAGIGPAACKPVHLRQRGLRGRARHRAGLRRRDVAARVARGGGRDGADPRSPTSATMNAGARFLREQGLLTRTGLTALQITRPVVAARPPRPGDRRLPVRGGSARASTSRWSATSARRPRADRARGRAGERPPRRRRRAGRIHGVALQPAGETSGGAAPTVDRATGGSVSTSGGCVTFTPGTQPDAALELTIPANGVVLTAQDGPATVTLRRFADEFSDKPSAGSPPATRASWRSAPTSPQTHGTPRVVPEARLTACGR